MLKYKEHFVTDALTLFQDLARIQAEQAGPEKTSSFSQLTWEEAGAAWESVATSSLL